MLISQRSSTRRLALAGKRSGALTGTTPLQAQLIYETSRFDQRLDYACCPDTITSNLPVRAKRFSPRLSTRRNRFLGFRPDRAKSPNTIHFLGHQTSHHL